MLWRFTLIFAPSVRYFFPAMLINANSNMPAQPPTQNATTTHHIDMIDLVVAVRVALFPHSPGPAVHTPKD